MASTIGVEKSGRLSFLAPATSRLSALAPPLLQLGLVLLLIHQYHIESRTFFNIAVLTVVGFAIHALLPLAYRLSFFALLSVVGVGVAFGLRDGGFLLALGLVLIGLCHLPIRLRYRVVLLLVTAGVFATGRAGLVDFPWSSAVWPILASMFMFRLAVYLYALHYERAPVSPSRTLAYFFMLPNVCFPLYPVVDYATFNRTYYDRPEKEIYDRGVEWIVRGLVHLLLYRFIYLRLTSDPATAANLGDVVQFMLSTFGLYLRVSGQFHLIVGMLHLFGFRLPETHRLYYLASSFTDFWRRINIYWKDFMMKLVYYPSFVALKPRMGERSALIAATVVVFLGTWLLHSYQWFWLRGGFPLTAQDGLFWGILGAFVVVNSLREMRRGRKRVVGKTAGWNLRLGVQTALMFWTMTVLWSLWSSESVGEWLMLLGAAANVDVVGVGMVVLVTGVILYLGGVNRTAAAGAAASVRLPFYRTPAMQHVAILLGLLVAGQPQVSERGGIRFTSLINSLHSTTLNARDAALQHQGYYEQLDNQSRLSAELWELQAGEPSDWIDFRETTAVRRRSDFLSFDIQPSTAITFKDAALTTNRWGMRDRDYAMQKPPGTFRFALLGPSITMGSGVADEETFDAVLEEHLNALPGPNRHGRYEILNFSVPGYSIVQQMALLEDRILDFQPDAVLITVPTRRHRDRPIGTHLMDVLEAGASIPYPELTGILGDLPVAEFTREGMAISSPRLRSILDGVGMETRMPRGEFQQTLLPFADQIVDWSIGRMVRFCTDRGISPMILALDDVGDWSHEEHVYVEQLAHRHDVPLLDLYDVYRGRDPNSLRLAEWDNHPNAAANRLIAEKLLQELSSAPIAARIGLLQPGRTVVQPRRASAPGDGLQGDPPLRASGVQFAASVGDPE